MRKVREDSQKGLQTCKFCVLCEHWHPLNEFYTDRAKADGLRPYCKPCEIARARGTLASIEKCRGCREVKACRTAS